MGKATDEVLISLFAGHIGFVMNCLPQLRCAESYPDWKVWISCVRES